MSPAQKAQNLIDLVIRLTDLIERENDMLESRPKSEDLAVVVQEKQRLFADYETMIQNLGGLSGLSAELDPGLRDELIRVARRFDEAMRQNERRLDAMVRASQRIMEIMRESVQKVSQPVGSYNAGGATKAYSGKAVAVAINETL